MRRATAITCLAVITLAMTEMPALAAPVFRRVLPTAEGPSLLITFKEAGLQPGQNYAYTGDGAVSETFQCYRDRTFTPTRRTATISGAVSPDPRSRWPERKSAQAWRVSVRSQPRKLRAGS